MAKTYTFVRKAVLGFMIRIASRRTDYPFVGYYGSDGTIVTDYKQAQLFSTQVLATAALPSVKSLLIGEMGNACHVEVTNKAVIAQASA
jgi:hypothetical protein